MAQNSSLAKIKKFRLLGRRILQIPNDCAAHTERVKIASQMSGAEHLQGAIADMIYSCPAKQSQIQELIEQKEIKESLSPHIAAEFTKILQEGKKISPTSPLATRYSALIAPSMDVPKRAILVSSDDSKNLAQTAIKALQEAKSDIDSKAEQEKFLNHCAGAGDILAFMLVRRALTKAGIEMLPEWENVSQDLQIGR